MFTPTLDGPSLRIGIYRTSSIGDMILGTACLDALAVLPIRPSIVWIGRNPALDLIKESYPSIETIELTDSTTATDLDAMISKLKSLHFMVDLQRSVRSRLFCQRLSSSGVKIYGMKKAQVERNRLIVAARLRGRSRPLSLQSVQVEQFQFEMMLNALYEGLRDFLPVELLDPFRTFNPKPKLPISQNKLAKNSDKSWLQEMNFGRWIALAPGAAHETKRAQPELFQSILTKVNSDFPDLNLVILGNEDDRRYSMHILDRLMWKGNVLNLAGKLSLADSAIALRKSSLLLSNDSSLAHIAEAVGKPAFVLFGPTIERFGFSPHRPDSRSFSSLIGCRPCSKHGKSPCRFQDQMCFLNIQPTSVATAIRETLSKLDPSESDSNQLLPSKNASKQTAHHHPIHSQF